MIPKIIHYSWFSGDPYPQLIARCMISWKEFLPDYEFVLWDMQRSQEIDNVFLKEALHEKKWAFAADVVRCYAIYTYGGIWLDTDVEIFRSFDHLLNNRLFIGREASSFFDVADLFRHIYPLGAHCFGAEAGHPFLKRCLQYYQGRHFVTSCDCSLPMSLHNDMRILPEIMAILAAKEFGYLGSLDKEEYEEFADDGMRIFPYFICDMPRYHSPKDVVAIHYLCGGWVNQTSVTPAIRGFRMKDWKYYVFHLMNKVLSRWRLKINLQSF